MSAGTGPTGAAPACPEHGPPAEPGHRFCEVCGRDLATGEPPAQAVPAADGRPATAPPWLSSRAPEGACATCGEHPGDGPYCDHCGRRRTVGQDYALLDLGSSGPDATIAGVTDRGQRRKHNEDAVAIGRDGGAIAAVVCDGVSTSTRADVASHAAAEAGIAALLAAVGEGEGPAAALTRSAHAAAEAARAAALPNETHTPPSCTYVAAIVDTESVTVGWIGDSRAYWVGAQPGDAACLTIDDSVAGQVAAGRPIPAGAPDDPASRALIRWLGADSQDREPQLASVRPVRPGRLILCSDGLFSYLPEPEALAKAMAGMPASPATIARDLTRLAYEAGGHDNIAVAVLTVPTAVTSGGAP
jgi:serine/threonine protein phosphatase PrpC